MSQAYSATWLVGREVYDLFDTAEDAEKWLSRAVIDRGIVADREADPKKDLFRLPHVVRWHARRSWRAFPDAIEAAKRAGLRTRTMCLAIQKPHVRAYLHDQRRALLAGISAKNISRAAAIRDQDENRMAALGAIKLLEDGGNPAGAAGPVRTPGICIQIVKAS